MKLDKVLKLFNLRLTEKEIFEVLFHEDNLGASEIAKKVNISRTSVYDLLDKLVALGLLVESQKGGVKLYSSQSPEAIRLLIEDKEKTVSEASSCLNELEDEYYKKRKNTKPKLKIFEGRSELQQMMNDMLLYKDITAYVFWPIKDIIKVLTPEFYKEFHQKRIKRNIKIKVIWPEKQKLSKKIYEFLQSDKGLLRELKVTPKNIDFSLGYAIYKDTVRFISSNKELYGFLVESKDMADMMRKQFEIIWGISKKLSSRDT